jgi:signal transduction histidine kinase
LNPQQATAIHQSSNHDHSTRNGELAMQETGHIAGWGGAGQVQPAVEALAAPRNTVENLAEVAHDARNMVTALGLYCDLLEEPGVLAEPYRHYGSELRLVAAASRRLVEKLLALDSRGSPFPALRDGIRGAAQPPLYTGLSSKVSAERSRQTGRWDLMPALPIDSLGRELLANRNLLAALAGPSIALTVETEGGALPVRLTGEDLTRVLVNLVKNAAEAMPAGGRIQLSLRERPSESGAPEFLRLTIEDTGPGIPKQALEKVFEAGFSTQLNALSTPGWPAAHRGLGLSITRSIIEAAGGRIVAANRASNGASFQIELPVRKR